jgi:hypothetical protein
MAMKPLKPSAPTPARAVLSGPMAVAALRLLSVVFAPATKAWPPFMAVAMFLLVLWVSMEPAPAKLPAPTAVALFPLPFSASEPALAVVAAPMAVAVLRWELMLEMPASAVLPVPKAVAVLWLLSLLELPPGGLPPIAALARPPLMAVAVLWLEFVLSVPALAVLPAPMAEAVLWMLPLAVALVSAPKAPARFQVPVAVAVASAPLAMATDPTPDEFATALPLCTNTFPSTDTLTLGVCSLEIDDGAAAATPAVAVTPIPSARRGAPAQTATTLVDFLVEIIAFPSPTGIPDEPDPFDARVNCGNR